MDTSVAQAVAGFGVFAFLFGVLLCILWLLVPFAIFGIKPLLRRMISQLEINQKQNNELLSLLSAGRQGTPAADGREIAP